MKPPSEDIKDYLVGISSLALTSGTDLFIHLLPDTPNNCVCVYDTGGFDSEAAMTYQRPTVQIKVRGEKGTYDSTHEQAQGIRDELHTLHNETINSTRYIQVLQQGDIIDLGDDEKNRPVISMNFAIHRTTG